jgi:hypothetical protein
MNIYDKLQVVQNKLNVPKNQYNKFGDYNYRSCEDIFEAIKPILTENKLYLTMTDEIINIGDRNYVKATATLSDGENKIKVSACAREAVTPKAKTDDSQLTGGTSSYARKYALNGLFLIDDVKDSDSTNKHEKEPQNANKGETDKQWLNLTDYTGKPTNLLTRIQELVNEGKPVEEILEDAKKKYKVSKKTEEMIINLKPVVDEEMNQILDSIE